MTSAHALNIADLRRMAQRRLPRVVFDYIDGGADDEVTLRENCRVFDDVTFRPRSAVATPILRSAHDRARRGARVAVAAGAGRKQPSVLPARRRGRGPRGRPAGTAYILSTLSGCRTRRRQGRHVAVRRGISSTWSADATSPSTASRARDAAGFSVLVVTIDTPVAGIASATCGTATQRTGRRASPTAMLPFLPQFFVAAAVGGGLPRRRRADELSQRRDSRRRTDVVRGSRRRARAVDGLRGAI